MQDQLKYTKNPINLTISIFKLSSLKFVNITTTTYHVSDTKNITYFMLWKVYISNRYNR